MKYRRILRAFAGVVGAGLVCGGCSEDSTRARPDAAALPEEFRSAHFESTVAHLDVGGTFFTYLDVDGDYERFAALLQDTADAVLPVLNADVLPAGRDKIDVAGPAERLGFGGVEAIGMSSVQKRKGVFHNKAANRS